MNLRIKDKNSKINMDVRLDLEYALQQCEQLKIEINQHENDLAYKYPVYKLLNEADAGRKVTDYKRLLSAAENSGAYKSLEWFSLYLAIARKDVWHEVATLICMQNNRCHDFITINNNGASETVCRHCGCRW